MARDLREFLTEQGVTYLQTAFLTGLDTSTISLVVCGHRRAAPATVVRLAAAFKVTSAYMRALCDAALPPDEELAAAGDRRASR
jgi:transcriptional regulator with XRE-family HTH domain